ncbi:EthD domain-containing protein [Chelativorans sp. SCAU2101]|jgi:EthD protein.|uniref:EthD domain-containing protein n=1 Tax=Chelativorans petroleitrophicus TaxID=2975484 RepID=A0A9X2X8Y3_9HYPH|nr:EthD domain-containing protein [Chelativorans petroleitrophicus]MCT8990254.1 EthD domain-containing protein [Chelativorans petroleitrophicus]
MITALSLIRRRADIDLDTFRRHWLDPHGVLAAGLPHVRRYIQGHIKDSSLTNVHAREAGIDGFAVLSFDTVEQRDIAYQSPRIRECDRDSESFIGAVRRVVTVATPHGDINDKDGLKIYLLGIGDPAHAAEWSREIEARLRDVPSPKSRVVHEILSQSHAPGSKVPELRLPVCGFAELRFPESALGGSHAKILAGHETETVRTALFVADDYQLV